MPATMPEVWEQIGAGAEDTAFDKLGTFGVLRADVTVKKGRVLFPQNRHKERDYRT